MPKNPHADFTPTLAGYSGITPFRFWCQTALPLTYDDSLSYYELLNKVVNYLNHTIEDLTNVENNTTELAEAYDKLQKYVNDYFDDIDIEAELRNVLDGMAEDGTLDALLDPLVANRLPGVVEQQIDDAVSDQIDGAVAGQIGGAVAEQLPAVASEQIPEEVTSWLDDNVTPTGSAVMVDSSLTISGAAADAKTTGDKIAVINSRLDEAIGADDETIDSLEGYEEHTGRFNNNDWRDITSQNYKYVFVPIERTGGVLSLQRDPDKGAILFAIVKSYTPPTQENEAIDYSDDPRYTATITIGATVTEERTYDIPSDAGGILITTLYNNTDRIPLIFNVTIPGIEGELKEEISEIKNEIEEILGTPTETITDISVYPEHNGRFNNNDFRDITSQRYKYAFVPIERTGGVLSLQRDPDKGAILFAIVKSYTPPTQENEAIDYSDDPRYTATITIGATVTEERTYDIPSDAGGILITTLYNNTDRIPLIFNLTIPGTEGEIPSQIREISEKVDELDNSKIDIDAYEKGYFLNLNRLDLWEAGAIRDDGTNSPLSTESSQVYARTKTFISDRINGVIAKNYGFIVFRYKTDGTFDEKITNPNYGTTSRTTRLYKYTKFDHENYKYRIMVERNQDAEIDEYVKSLCLGTNPIDYAESPYFRNFDKSIKAPIGWYGFPEWLTYSDALNLDTPYDTFMGLYDTLIENSKGYLKKSILGKDLVSPDTPYKDIYRIDLNASDYNIGEYNNNKVKLIVVCGQQGSEKANCYGMYYLAKLLSESFCENPILQYIHNYVHIILIPALSPWGFDNSSYVNGRGVSLNRNYYVPGWEEKDYGTNDYTGPEAFSEPETQIVRDIVLGNEEKGWESNLDALMVIDSHLYGGTMISLAKQNWVKLVGQAKYDPYYKKLVVAGREHLIAYTSWLYYKYNLGATDTIAGEITNDVENRGCLDAWATVEAGIIGMTFEGISKFYSRPETYTSDVIRNDGELLMNWIGSVLRRYINY